MNEATDDYPDHLFKKWASRRFCDYLVENRLTAADVVTGGVLLWALKLGMMNQTSPVKTYIENLSQRPAFKKANPEVYAQVN